jgi:hypothetical protein
MVSCLEAVRRTDFFCMSCREWKVRSSRWMLEMVRSEEEAGERAALARLVTALSQMVTYWVVTVGE